MTKNEKEKERNKEEGYMNGRYNYDFNSGKEEDDET
jgi:hypothetical protein